MATTPFSDVIRNGRLTDGSVLPRSKALARANAWYKSTASNVNKMDLSEKARLASTPKPGSLYLFQYDPKHKDTLPYYDTFPLIFPIEPAPDGFYGLNLHYLDPRLRAALMDKLHSYASDQRYDMNTKLNINYHLLKETAKLKLFKPCLKRYLNAHVRSKFMTIYPAEWDYALMLPLQRFQKASQQKVWADSAGFK